MKYSCWFMIGDLLLVIGGGWWLVIVFLSRDLAESVLACLLPDE